MYISSFADDRVSSISLDSCLKETLCSFARSQVLFVAIRLDLFTQIDQSPRQCLSADEIGKLNISLSLLAYLVYLRLLERCVNSTDYQCTHVTRTYLVSTSRNYVGLGIGVWDYRRQYTFFLRLGETLRTGRRTSEDDTDQSTLWSAFEHHQHPMIYFAGIMSAFTRCTIGELCEQYDFSSHSTLLDIGGSLGDLTRTILQHNPHLQGISFDLPGLTNYARSLPNENARLRFCAGDLFDKEWPDEILAQSKDIDLVTLKYILHDWSHEQRQYIIKKIHRLLTRDGQGQRTLIVIEKMIDRKRENLTSLSTSVSMAVECGDGIGYDGTQDEYEQLLRQAGFQRIGVRKLTGPMVALIAHLI